MLGASKVGGFELGAVEMVEKSGPAKRRSKKKRVRLPYHGPQLWDLWVTASVGVDRDHSTIRLVEQPSGGSPHYEVDGIEHYLSVWDPGKQELIRKRVARKAASGLFISKWDLQEAVIFRVHEFPAWIFCTDSVKHAVEEQGFSNVSFLEAGEITLH